MAPAESSGLSGSFSNPSPGVYCLADAPAGAKSVLVSASTQGVSPAAGDLFASVDLAVNNDNPNYSGCASGTDNVRVTLYDLSAHAMVNGSFRIWFED